MELTKVGLSPMMRVFADCDADAIVANYIGRGRDRHSCGAALHVRRGDGLGCHHCEVRLDPCNAIHRFGHCLHPCERHVPATSNKSTVRVVMLHTPHSESISVVEDTAIEEIAVVLEGLVGS